MPDAPGVADASALGFDPTDPGFIADPYPVFDRLRAAGPALAYPARDVTLLTRFADVHAALRDRKLGRAYTHLFSHDEFGQSPPDPHWTRFAESERWSLLNLEPPDHTRLRRLVTKVFTARSVAAMGPHIEALAADRAAALDSEFDLIADYAQPFSVAVICMLLGVPQEDGPRLLDWSHAIVKMYEFSTPQTEKERAERAAAEFIAYVKELIARRRTAPTDDLVSELVQVSDSGDRLTEDEIVGTVIVLLNAGHEATVNTLGNGMRAFGLHPDQWRRVTSGEVAPDVAVEEMLRWDAPLQLFERWVLDEVTLAGRTFQRGERIAMMFGCANRDPERFGKAEMFDAGRGDQTHIGFGGGLHFCIGAPLARLEIAASLAQFKGFELALTEDPVYQPYFVIRGLTGLHLQRKAIS